jgi:hypothetical protein
LVAVFTALSLLACASLDVSLNGADRDLDELRSDLDAWPIQHKLVLDRDTIVFFTYPHAARLWDQAAFIYHLPSMSSVNFNSNGDVAARNYRTLEGEQRLERAIQDPGLLAQVKALIPWDSR